MTPPEDRLFAQKGYTLFWLGRIGSASANQMLAVAVGWQVWSMTGSAYALGFVGLLQFLPRLILMPVAGNLADRLDRKRLIMAAQLTQAAGLAVLAITSATGTITLPVIYLLMLVTGTGRTFETPTTQAFVPLLVPIRLLPRAVAMNASAHQVSTIVAPAVAGFIYVAGPDVVYGVATVLIAIASILLLWVHPVRAQRFSQRGRNPVDTFLEGLRFIRHHRPVLGALSLDMMAVLLGGATALLPIIASEVLHTGAWGLGLLRSAPAVGALVMSVWLAGHPMEGRVGPRLFGSVAIFGVATIVFGLSTHLWLSMGALVVLGAADMVSMVFRGAYIQLATPDDMRGRVGAVNSLFIGASNQLGEFESGVTAAWFGAVPAIVLGGVGTLIVVVLWMRWFPELARLDRLPDGEARVG